MGIRVAIAVAPLCACAAVLGIDDGHPRGVGDDGGVGDATLVDAPVVYGDDGTNGDDSSVGLPTEPDGAPIPTTCEPGIAIDATHGAFVATTGDDGAACTQTNPCKTIQTGISAAHNAAAAGTVYVQDGLYDAQQITMQAGIDVIGGWTTAWERHCSQTSTTVRAPASASSTVLASFNGTAKLSTITIESKANDDVSPGETVYGIRATGGSTTLALAFVDVSTANGGDGAAGGAGDAGATPTGPCLVPADGGSSTELGGKGNGADAGWFDSLGYETPIAAAGVGGPSGANGTGGAAGACVHCLTNCTGTALCSYTDAGLNCGDPGEPGCGGLGGLGGIGGGSGGSSVALFVADATVNVTGSAFQSGNGGIGGAGGAGGGAGNGANGATGALGPASPICYTTCALNISCTGGGATQGAGGKAGGQGGAGGGGGPGGDGAGGDSYAVVQSGTAAFRMFDAGSSLNPGKAGSTVDGGNGAPGAAAAQVQP